MARVNRAKVAPLTLFVDTPRPAAIVQTFEVKHCEACHLSELVAKAWQAEYHVEVAHNALALARAAHRTAPDLSDAWQQAKAKRDVILGQIVDAGGSHPF